ncbi:RecQ family ATP-dependent DNA helicase [Sanguibacter antarcticus]|uniref:DNA 3'-5' helicase n=1 Tax=Sanguibacter antarcticus TaxID=372484 RepID=A0A2A9E3N9_9MICO|nr:RecQ family ATP-dependent DNA helicase [Sanguibacter antarcticus]PFG33443.1 ATP-dependent DNA helicase RecQ [Sanguibacter antarcticus]
MTSPADPALPASDTDGGPVKPRGPKRWGVEPDWSKLPTTRRAPIVDDSPAWGTSSIDARQLMNLPVPDELAEADESSDDPDEAAVDETPAPESAPVEPEAVEPRIADVPVARQAPVEQAQDAPAQDEAGYDDPYKDVPYFDEPPGDPAWADEPHPADGAPAQRSSTRRPAGRASERPTVRPVPRTATSVVVGDDEDLRPEAEAALRRLVGRQDVVLRDDQWTAIDALVREHRRALVVQRTGWGKSAVYFVSTALLRARGAGPTIIISPLLALMRDQISAAERAGIRAATINSANVTEWDQIHAQIESGQIDVLLCSPERLNNPGFRDEVLPRLAADAGLVVIDEAHCVSDWGHDFRPDYRRIRTLLGELPTGIPVLATTATANSRVTQDVAEQLEVPGADGARAEVLVLRGGLDRESLHLSVLRLGDQPTRVAWLLEALRSVQGSGIVYCLTVSVAEQVAAQLKAAGIPVAAYTGRTDPTERESLEADLKANRVKALVATSALGMGFDKPDLGFVVHMGAPSSPIAYYQQVGRAGRAVDSALVVLLPGEEDRRIWEYFGSLAFPQEHQVRATLDALARGGTQSAPALETQVDLTRSRLEMMLKVLDVDGAVKRVKGGWESTGQGWSYDADRYARVEQARLAEQRTMLDYIATDGCRMAFLRATLDDPDLAPGTRCGRCDNCGGADVPAAPSTEHVSQARQAMDVPGVTIEPRKMWPSGMASLDVDLKGKIPESQQAAPGRAVARLDGLGWSQPLRELFAPSTPDGETPVHLRRAVVQVLDAWPAGKAVDGVVAIRSTTRPVLVQHLAHGLATYLGKPFVGTIGPAPAHEEPGRHDVNSAMRLASVEKRLVLELSPAAAAGLEGRALLLVDDLVGSGWTQAVAARLLRAAGARTVLPLVLAQR